MAAFGIGTYELLAALAVVFTAIYLYMTSTFDYWAKRGIPFLPPTPFVGSSKEFVFSNKFRGQIGQGFYNYAKQHGYKCLGVFLGRRPVLVVCDVDLVKTILVKDFQYFMDRGIYFDREREPLSANLFNLAGAEWKTLRSKLTPTFTSGKMKNMFYLIQECAEELEQLLQAETAKTGGDMDMTEVVAKFTTDNIASCAFGLKANSMKDSDAEFRAMGRQAFHVTRLRAAVQVIAETLPPLRKLIPVPLINTKVSNFFTRTFNENVQFREKNGVMRHDFLDLLIQLKHNGAVSADSNGSNGVHKTKDAKDATGIDESILPAQAFVFFLAGFETSSGASSACLMFLAQNPEIQERLCEEVDTVLARHNGTLTYEAMQEMTYMEQCLEETMRMFPALSLLPRVVTRDYQLPDSKSVVPAGTRVLIPIYAIHHDPEYFPDPQRFDPERFSPENKKNRPHCAYMPFGEGPRICIGARFAWMQMKAALTTILRSYKVTPNDHTTFPLKFEPKAFVSKIDGGACLRLIKREAKATL